MRSSRGTRSSTPRSRDQRHDERRNRCHGAPRRTIIRRVWVRLGDYSDHRRYEQQQAAAIAQQRAVESELARMGDRFSIEGRCFVCDRQTDFHTDYTYAYPVSGILTPNWREHLKCSGCLLNNRMRATIHLFQTVLRPADGAPIYLMEQTSPLFESFSGTYPQSIGSEYLGTSIPFGESNARGIRNERATQLTFAAAQFERVISLDVLEHVPNFLHALAECRRVLRPGGTLLLSVPFRADYYENLLRAVVENDGSIRHLVTPEYMVIR